MKKVFLVSLIAILFIFLLVASAQTQPPPRVSKTEPINISGSLKQGQEPKLHPASVYVDRGAQVVWQNASDTPIRIRFGEGTNCKRVAQVELVQYQWSLLCCIVTPVIPPKTAIEMFPDEGGAFDYEIEFVGTTKKMSGVMKIMQ